MMRSTAQRQRGLTLLELLIAAAIGAVVIAGSLKLYVNVLESAAFQNANARVLENGRFAVDHVARTIRMARYDDPDTTGGEVAIALQAKDPSNNKATLNSITKGKTGFTPNTGADAIEISYEGATNPDGDRAVDCAGVAVAPGTWVSNTYVLSDEDELLCHSTSDVSALYVVAEGVEDMAIVYGVDTDGDGVANQYLAGGAVADWDDVVTIRIALLVNSVENVFANTIHGCESCSLFNPAADLRLRGEFHTTVRVRSG